MRTSQRLLVSAVAVSALALGQTAATLAPATGQPARTAKAAACTPVPNIEAIIDDSGSMSLTDENRLRVQALNILIRSLAPTTTLGAVEFGTSADTVFAPAAVGPNAAGMSNALSVINADNGTTNYSAAFQKADADNPGSAARIFLTDGQPDTFANDHLVHRVPTYVIGFSAALTSAVDQARLQQIASDTGGAYYPLADSSSLQAAMNNIVAALTCAQPPVTYQDNLTTGGTATHTTGIKKKSRSITIALTWANPANSYSLTNLKLKVGKRVVAKNNAGARKMPKLKLRVDRGP
ncbi:MAG: hypothetical protein JWO46_2475, partial [Nocardioidaceae bacterium]|nr:hypothetical protein [Nocardioidaceae bacterium]